MPDCEVKEIKNVAGAGVWPPGGSGTTSTATGAPVIPGGGDAPGGSGGDANCGKLEIVNEDDSPATDTILRNGTFDFKATGFCYGPITWTVSVDAGSGLGGSTIDEDDVLTAGATACGSLKVTATCEGCGTSATQYVRVSDAGAWVLISQTEPPAGCTVGSNCGSGLHEIISGKNKNIYQSTQCQGALSLCGVIPGNPCGCVSPSKNIWIYIDNYEWKCP